MDIRQLIEKDEYIIILDTNVLLNIYRYSKEFSDFALECLKAVKEYITLPATVRLEYGKHCRGQFARMQERVKNAGKETSEQIQRAREKVLSTCDNLERLQFPEIKELRDGLSEKMDELQKILDDFFQDRSSLELISHSWNNVDYLMKLVEEWETSGKIMVSPSQEDIYIWCDERKDRYKKEVPPGFKDAKDKDGVRKYSDLILWKEVMRFAIKEKKNIIFVTDDVKPDWWENVNGSKRIHQKLVDEFAKTGQQLLSFVSKDFYNAVAIGYGIEETDAVEIALRMTDADYCISIADEVFESIEGFLTYSNTDYIDVLSSHIGSEGIDELELTDHVLISAERIDRNNDEITYHFKYQVTARGTSYEYWGRDDDTKEVIRSYGTDHVFEGIIIVEVIREADIYLDFEVDSGFEKAVIFSGELEEIEYEELWPYEPEPGELGFCPDCGCPLNVDNDGGNGFCFRCAPEH